MIGFVKGIVDLVAEDRVILDVNGVGYNIFVTTPTSTSLGEGEEIKLYTYLSVREDAMNLFGFLTNDELGMFKGLITVSGIGPKAALSILSILSVDDLRFAIISGDDKTIAKAPGIGAKTAMKVILELKDKVDISEIGNVGTDKGNIKAGADNTNASEAVMALVSLGYSQSESVKAVKGIDTQMLTVEDIIKEALRKMI